MDMEIKTPQELNLTQEKGVAWLEKTPKIPSEQPRLGWFGGGTPSPTNTGEGRSFSNPAAPISKNLRPTHNSGTQPAGLNPLETPGMRHLVKLTLSCIKSSSSLYKVHENLGKICIVIHTPASVLGGSS